MMLLAKYATYITDASILLGLFAIVLLVYMLFKIINEQDKIHQEIRRGNQDLLDAGKDLYTLTPTIERLTNQLASALESNPSPSSSGPTSNLNQEKLERILSEFRSLINTQSKLNTKDDSSSMWSRVGADIANRINMSKSHLNNSIEKVSKDIAHMLEQIGRLGYLSTSQDQSMKELQGKLDNYQMMVIKARERAKQAENTIEDLEAELAELRSRQTQISQTTPTKDTDTLVLENALESMTKERDTIKKERDAMKNEVESLRDEISRTKIEKDFIETKFVELDYPTS